MILSPKAPPQSPEEPIPSLSDTKMPLEAEGPGQGSREAREWGRSWEPLALWAGSPGPSLDASPLLAACGRSS